ncbi:MAG: tRNA lysidine(34) synthetase TilS [Bacteroidia bacterium]
MPTRKKPQRLLPKSPPHPISYPSNPTKITTSPSKLPHHVASLLHQKLGFIPSSALIACSGGPDSVACASLLREIGVSIALAHVNYKLRPEAIQEQQLVQNLATQWNVPLYILEVSNPPKGSTQEKARQIRYQWLSKIAQEKTYPWIALGHTQDDRIETLLHRLLRSLSPSLWEDIPFHNPPFFRPLWETPRTEVIKYLREKNLPFALDASNYNPTLYERNWVRWRLVPNAHKIEPAMTRHLLHKVRLWQAYKTLLNPVLHEIYYHSVSRLSYGYLLKPMNWAAFYALWQPHIGHTATERAFSLYEKKVGKKLPAPPWHFTRVPQGIEAAYTPLLPPVSPFQLPPQKASYLWGLWEIQTQITDTPPNGCTVMWDLHTLHFPLRIRPWQPGDRYPTPTQKVSDLLQKNHWHGIKKAYAFVVEDARGIILYVSGAQSRPQPRSSHIFCLFYAYARHFQPPKLIQT